MPICIICREEKKTFSDEHVIPDSLKGYYHIYSVCADCNSSLGIHVDSKLVNHKFMEFQRHHLNIRGKKGALPNPFSEVGTLSGDPEQKVRIEMDDEGNFRPRLLPQVPEYAPGSTSYRFTIDKRDAHLKESIINKVLKRNGIDRSQVNFQEVIEREKQEIHSSILVDIKEFRIGMLKIAYEFTVDSVASYFDDETAVTISKILYSADMEAMDTNIQFFGNGFGKEVLQPLAHLIDFDNNNHYLILVDVKGVGLVCMVNLFHSFSIAVHMSTKANYLGDNTVFGINDIKNRCFEKIDIEELMRRTYSPTEYGFQYFFPTLPEALEFEAFQNNHEYEHVTVDGQIPLHDRHGNIRYKSLDEKLAQPHLTSRYEGDEINEMITEIELDEELFVLLNPGMQLVQVAAVRIISRRLTKL